MHLMFLGVRMKNVKMNGQSITLPFLRRGDWAAVQTALIPPQQARHHFPVLLGENAILAMMKARLRVE